MPIDRPDIARVSAEGTFQGESFINVFHFQTTSPVEWDSADLAALLDTLSTASTNDDSLAHFYSLLDSGLVINTLEAVNLDDVDPIGASKTVTIAGTSSGTDTPALVSLVGKWGTGFASRRRRGRSFFTGINTGMLASGDPDRIDPTFAGTMQTALQEFADAWVANVSQRFVVFSRTAELAVPLSGEAEVLTASVNPVIGVQRRRRPAA